MEISTNPKINLIKTIYLLGRKLRFSAKEHNSDSLFRYLILAGTQTNYDCPIKSKYCLADLAEKHGIKPSAFSEFIQKLKSEGLLEKLTETELAEQKQQRPDLHSKQHESHHMNHALHLKLTNKGKEELKRIEEEMAESCVDLFVNLTDVEIKTLNKLLNKIAL